MSDQAIQQKLKLTRDQIAQAVGQDHNTIKQFERLFEVVNEIVIPEATLEGRIAEIKYFLTYRDRSAARLEPFAFDNAVSTSGEYTNLWDEIGHMFNQQHVDAGDADLSASSTLFYPTPVPGKYGRSGFQTIEFSDSNVNFSTDRITGLASWVNNNRRDGSKFTFNVVSGTAPSPLNDGDTVYVAFLSASGEIHLSTTEQGAIDLSSIINFTDSGSGTFRLTQEGIAVGHAVEEHGHEQYSGNLGIHGGGPDRLLSSTANPNSRANDANRNVLNANVSNETRPTTHYEFGYVRY